MTEVDSYSSEIGLKDPCSHHPGKIYCIVLYLLPVLNPKSYDGAQVLEASGRPMLVIGRS